MREKTILSEVGIPVGALNRFIADYRNQFGV